MKKHLALKGVDFEVRSRRITGFIGSNGAGKTTSIRCLLGFTHFDEGEVSFFDAQPLSSKVRRRLGYMPEHPNFPEQLTGVEFLKLHAGLSGLQISRKELLKHLARVQLEESADRYLKEYSKGMLQRVGLAQSLIHQPELLVLDEPMSGLDPDGRRLVKSILQDVASEGMTLFFSTHLLDDVEDLCDDVVLVSKGEIRYSGDLRTLLGSSEERFKLVVQDQQEIMEHFLSSRAELDKEIRNCLSRSCVILEVRPMHKKLEEVYSQYSQERNG